jgi:hypothetical protein
MELEEHTTCVRVDDPAHATPSDHEALWWEVQTGSEPQDPAYTSRGWAVADWLADDEKMQAAEDEWKATCANHPPLDDTSTPVDIEAEAIWIRTQLTTMLDRHAKKITITARSKRWWDDNIRTARATYGRFRRDRQARKLREPTEEEIEARNSFLSIKRRAKRQCWTSFLESATGDEVWDVLRCTKARDATVMGSIVNERGECAEDDQDKRRMMAEVSFPSPNVYSGPQAPLGPPGKAYQLVDHDLVHQALYQQSSKKAPGKDAIGVPVVKALFRWDSQRIIALIRQCIRLGFHPEDWKTANVTGESRVGSHLLL